MSARPRAPTSVRAHVTLAVALAAALGAGTALATRPPEVVEAERRLHSAELDHLIRRADSLTAQVGERRGHLRRRMRSLYKLSQGGYVRLVLGADTPAQLFARRDAGKRVLSRDLGELGAIRAELDEIAGLREHLRERQLALTRLAVEARDHRPSGPASRGGLINPVRGARVERPFGAWRDPRTQLEFSRDGVDLGVTAGDTVRSPGAGVVRHVGEVPGLGVCVILDLSDGWAALLGPLAAPGVRIGERVAEAQTLGDAATNRLHYQLQQEGVWIDPAPHLLPSPAPSPAR